MESRFSRLGDQVNAFIEVLNSRNVFRKLPYNVRREKALVHSGRQTRPGTGSLHPVAIEAASEVTKPLEPSV